MTYEKLLDLSKEAKILQSVEGLLHWDQETKMPPKGAGPRAEQLEAMAKILHQKRTSKAFEKTLSELIDLETGKVLATDLSPEKKAALREWRRDFLNATSLPTRFVQRYAKLCSQSMEAWKEARAKSDFSLFAPFLEKLIDISREKAELLTGKPSYDALLDEFEPGMTQRQLNVLFGELQPALTKLRKGKTATHLPKGRYSPDKQMKIGKEIVYVTGFTDERARLDLTTHPFCLNLHPDDGRVTTRINPTDPLENILAILHEGGHYLYEANLPPEHFGSPLCEAISLGIHESQSRWWECLIGQSLPFWEHTYPLVKNAFPKLPPLPAFYKALNSILDTPIRINTDEVSYCLHIILRYECERDLISGKLAISDLPHVWNAKMKSYLNITPKNDAEGCLQDVHWSMGAIGYFPTYALGNLYAAQFFETFAKAHPNWDKKIATGEFTFMHEWLRDNIHKHGRRYSAAQLVKRVTGKPLSTKPYLAYLRKKYA